VDRTDRSPQSAVTVAQRTGRSLLTNLPLLVLSLGLSTVLWAYVTNQENPSLRKEVSFQVSSFDPINVPKSMIPTTKTPNDVTVTLIGAKDAVAAVRTEDIQLHVDLAGADASNPGGSAVNYVAPVKATVRRRAVRAEVNPASVRVTLEPVARRTVPVKVNSIDAAPIGFELETQPVADPPEATITGLKQNVDAVDAVFADLKLTGLSVSTSVPLPLSPRSSDGRALSEVTVSPATASVRITIKRTVFNRQSFVSVRTHGKPATGYQVVDLSTDPTSVTTAGALDTLNDVTTISTEDVEIEGATQDVKRVVALRPPPGITVVTPRNVSAVVRVEPARGPGAILVAPRLVGLASGLTAQLATTALAVSFVGPLPQVLALRPGDVTATVDLSNLGPGSYSLEPRLSLPPGLDRDAVTPPHVELVIVGTTPAATPSR